MNNSKPSYEDLQALVMNLTQKNVALESELSRTREKLNQFDTSTENARRSKKERFFLMFYPTLDTIEKFLDENKIAVVKVLLHIVRNAYKNGAFVQPMRSIAKELGMSYRTVQPALNSLVDSDVLIVGKSGRSNVYALNPQYVLKTNIKHAQMTAYSTIKRANNTTDKDAANAMLISVVSIDNHADNENVGCLEDE
jgi:DNA-binding transcriptional regulator YhcF (GntR family)